MTTTEQATGAAIKLARLAAVQESGLLSCPYPADATGVQSAARRAWLGEYRRLRPGPPVDYGDHATELADGQDDDGDGGPVVIQPDLFAEVPR